jgi:hypothetical protein
VSAESHGRTADTNSTPLANNHEIHVTTLTDYASRAEEVAQTLHWKTSAIMGDPVLGHKPFFYLTTHRPSYYTAQQALDTCCAALLEAGVPVVREKIEHIVWDVRHDAGRPR